MSLFKKLFGSSPSKEKIQKKGMEGIIHYKNRDFVRAVKSFEEYFNLKKSGIFPELDKEDAVMLFNFGNAKQYSNDFRGAISIYESISSGVATWDAPYLMKAVCLSKLGDNQKAKFQWELARKFGNDIAQTPFEEGIKKF